MIFKIGSEKFWHRYPKDRTFLEKLLRKFYLPCYGIVYQHNTWKRRDTLLKKRFPVRYFISEHIPLLWFQLTRKISEISSNLRYRYIDKYHIVKLGIEPGYRDPDDRLLYSNFAILEDFVEIELAAMWQAMQSDQSDPRFKIFRKLFRKSRRRNLRNPADGLAYLNDQIESGGPSTVKYSKIQKDLYLWWKFERSYRLEDTDAPEFTDLSSRESTFSLMSLEDFYYNQDSDMIAKLASIRSSLWT